MPVPDLRSAPSVLRTPRLELVEPDPALAPRLAEAVRHSHDALEFVPDWREAADVEVAARSLARSRELADTALVRHALDRATGAWVARVDLHSWDGDAPRAELGCIADARLSGRGLAREAALAMIALAWDLGARRVHTLTDTRNARALRFAESLGLEREGVLRHWELDDHGQLCDQVVHAAIR